MAKKEAPHPAESFEALLDETEALVAALESGELPLDEALQRYEKGVANLRACAKLLTEAEEKVKVLVRASEQEFRLEDLPAGADSDAEDGEDGENEDEA
jgi:exodeoxyribonuclease VII small subunit